MKELKLENIIINLSGEDKSVRVESDSKNVILINETIENVTDLIIHNFTVVNGYYKNKVNGNDIDLKDLDRVSFEIVMYYLYQYNSWANFGRSQKNRSSIFQKEDLNSSLTRDLIYFYYKTRYPDKWEEICSVLLGMEVLELRLDYKSRQEFYNK